MEVEIFYNYPNNQIYFSDKVMDKHRIYQCLLCAPAPYCLCIIFSGARPQNSRIAKFIYTTINKRVKSSKYSNLKPYSTKAMRIYNMYRYVFYNARADTNAMYFVGWNCKEYRENHFQ